MSKLFQIKQYIIYSIVAKGAFKIHSPFVFAFFNTVIKRKKDKKGLKKDRIIKNIYLFDKNFSIINLSSIENNITAVVQQAAKPYTIIILQQIHNTQQNHNNWIELKNKIKSCITVDFFHLGVIINNPMIKQKQDFILKNK